MSEKEDDKYPHSQATPMPAFAVSWENARSCLGVRLSFFSTTPVHKPVIVHKFNGGRFDSSYIILGPILRLLSSFQH